MKRWIIFPLAILVIVILSNSQASVHLGGIDGESLLKNITNSSVNLTGTNNSTNNHSTWGSSKPFFQLLGNGGKVLMKNLTNSFLNLSGRNNNTSDLDTWGSKPLPPPPPPDFSDFQNAQIVKDNRVE